MAYSQRRPQFTSINIHYDFAEQSDAIDMEKLVGGGELVGADANKVVMISSPYQNRAPHDLEARRAVSARSSRATSCSKASRIPTMRSVPIHSASTAIMVSNPRARRGEFDNAPSPLHVLPAIRCRRSATSDDGDVRSAASAAASTATTVPCMGAKFVFQGRPTLYGVTAGGIPGAKTALGIFRREVDISMAQIGWTQRPPISARIT